MGAVTLRPPPRPASPRRLSRRTALVAGAGGCLTALAAVSGCSVNNPFDTEPTPAREAVRDLSPDVAVAVEAVTAIRASRQLVDAVLRRHPALRTRFQGLLEMHRAHLDALTDAVPDGVDTRGSEQPPPVDPRRQEARGQVVDEEQRLHDRLTGLALRAESGAFARLLGSAAASVSQHMAASAGGQVGVRG